MVLGCSAKQRAASMLGLRCPRPVTVSGRPWAVFEAAETLGVVADGRRLGVC